MKPHQRIGVLGGTFDPIHFGHLILAERVADELQLDVVLFMPAASPPHKTDRLISPAEQRVQMIELAIRGNDRFALSDLDLGTTGPSFTSKLLERVHAGTTPSELFFIMGADSLREFATWHRPARILELTRLAVIGRPDYPIDDVTLDAVPRLREQAVLVPAPLIEISATDIRERVRQGTSIRYLVPDAVYEAIEKRGLYRSS